VSRAEQAWRRPPGPHRASAGQGAVASPTHQANPAQAGPAAACRPAGPPPSGESQQHAPLERHAGPRTTITSTRPRRPADVPRSGLDETPETRGSGSPGKAAAGRSVVRSESGFEHPGQQQDCRRDLANSEGCTMEPPMLIQRWAPRAEVPTQFLKRDQGLTKVRPNRSAAIKFSLLEPSSGRRANSKGRGPAPNRRREPVLGTNQPIIDCRLGAVRSESPPTATRARECRQRPEFRISSLEPRKRESFLGAAGETPWRRPLSMAMPLRLGFERGT